MLADYFAGSNREHLRGRKPEIGAAAAPPTPRTSRRYAPRRPRVRPEIPDSRVFNPWPELFAEGLELLAGLPDLADSEVALVAEQDMEATPSVGRSPASVSALRTESYCWRVIRTVGNGRRC